MNQPHTNLRYNFVIHMIKGASHEDKALLDMFYAEDDLSSKSLFYLIRKASICSKYVDPLMDYQKGYRILIDAVSDYLRVNSTSSQIKSRLYDRLCAWCAHIGKQYQIKDYQNYIDEIPRPVIHDIAVELVKELHNPEGTLKDELAHHYGVSDKTIQVSISRLNGKSGADPLRIGGQEVHVPVAYREETHRTDKRRYYTPNTMSPIIFQMNLMQVATLLQSLYLNYDIRGNNIPMDLAVDTWGQLSDYAKGRIRQIFCQRDPDFAEFLDLVEQAETSDTYRFMTESEIFKNSDVSWSERLQLAYKGGMICNLSLRQPFRSRKNQRIFYDHDQNSFYAVPANMPCGERLYFALDEVMDLDEA